MRARVAILHPELKGGAGSEAKAVWLAEMLKKTCSVTLATMGTLDLGRLNSIYGTALSPDEIATVVFPFPRWYRGRFDALRSYRLGRWAKSNAGRFECMISAYNTMDFGTGGIQFIADFSFDDRLRNAFDPAAGGRRGFFHRRSALRSAYLWLARTLARQSANGWRKNRTYANSAWSKAVFERRFGLECGIICPPVQDFPAGPAWEERENGIVVLARISPEKRLEKAIEIVAEVRRSGADVHLHILGREDDPAYAAEIRRLCEKRGDWARYEGLVVGAEKTEFIGRHRYGLSTRPHEPFGIGVAEMVKAGSIVWVPDGGGQVEIVDHEDLVFGSVEDAARKIGRVLADGDRRDALRRHLVRQADLFSRRRFIAEARTIVGEFLGSAWSEA